MNRVLAPAWRWLIVAAVIAAAALATPGITSPAAAQEEPPEGRIDGTIIPGTADADLGEVEVRLVIFEDGEIVEDQVEHTGDGTFEFTVPATEANTYIVTAHYQDVLYFDEQGPIALSADAPAATSEVRVYETTAEAPGMRISETVVAVVAIDRGTGEILLVREDFLELDGDRVFTGDEGGATLRLPAPANTQEADGGELDGNVLSVDTALHPGQNSIVTQYVVQYDRGQNEYTLRVTAPVETGNMTLRVPDGYVHRLDPLEEARHGEDYIAEGQEDMVMHTVVLETPSEPGRGLLVDIVGLTGPRDSHPLTELPGAGIAAAVALVLIGGAAVVGLRSQRGAGE